LSTNVDNEGRRGDTTAGSDQKGNVVDGHRVDDAGNPIRPDLQDNVVDTDGNIVTPQGNVINPHGELVTPHPTGPGSESVENWEADNQYNVIDEDGSRLTPSGNVVGPHGKLVTKSPTLPPNLTSDSARAPAARKTMATPFVSQPAHTGGAVEGGVDAEGPSTTATEQRVDQVDRVEGANAAGKRVDGGGVQVDRVEGPSTSTNAAGQRVDSEGNRIDDAGNRLDAYGRAVK
jgi:hypothetical protein